MEAKFSDLFSNYQHTAATQTHLKKMGNQYIYTSISMEISLKMDVYNRTPKK